VVCKRRAFFWLRALGSEVQINLTHHESQLLNCFLGKNNYRESENKKPKPLMFLFIFPMRLIWVLRILRLVQCCNTFLCQATTSAPLERSAFWVSAWEKNIDLAPECHGWPTSSDSKKKHVWVWRLRVSSILKLSWLAWFALLHHMTGSSLHTLQDRPKPSSKALGQLLLGGRSLYASC